MTEISKLIGELEQNKPGFKDAQAVVQDIRHVGDMLERMRVRAGLSQGELGERLGISSARVSQLESGTLRDAPSLKMLYRFAQACGEDVVIEAAGERGVTAAQGRPESFDLAGIRAELAELRDVLARRQSSDLVRAELAQLRDDIADLRTALAREKSVAVVERDRDYDVDETVVVASQSSDTAHGRYLMGNYINDQTVAGFKLAMQSVLTAAGCSAVDVDAAKPRLLKDAVSLTMTIK